mgnify:CR=1 FL=1
MKLGKIRRIMVMLLFLVVFLFTGTGQAMAKDDNTDEIVVYGGCYASTTTRYYQLGKITIDSGRPGTWEFWYSNDGVNYKKGYEDVFRSSVTSYPLSYKLYDLAGAAPDKPVNGTLAYNTGTKWYCPVSANSNSSLLYYQFFATWENGSRELFSSFLDAGVNYRTTEIPDPVKGYYYLIDNNSTSNFSTGQTGVTYTQSSNIPFDVTDFGKYLHVRAVSCSGKVSKVLDVKLDPDEPDMPKTVKLRSGEGIVSVSGAGSYLPGQTVTVSAELEEYYRFSGWSGTYDSGVQSYTFVMPNKTVVLTASANRPEYQLTYEAMGGSGGPDAECVKSGEYVTVSAKTPTRTNYSFVEWNEMPDGSGKVFRAGEKVQLTGNKTLFAIWKADTYTIRLHANRPGTASHAVEHGAYDKKTIELKDASGSVREANGIQYGELPTVWYCSYCGADEEMNFFFYDNATGKKENWGMDSAFSSGSSKYQKYIGAIFYRLDNGHYYKFSCLPGEHDDRHYSAKFFQDFIPAYDTTPIKVYTVWQDLGTSYPVTADSGWTWHSDGSNGEGYFEKTFTKSSEETLPSSADLYTLTGWHTTDSKSSSKENGTSWITTKNLDGRYYKAGTKVTDIALTDAGSKVIDLYAPWENNTYTVSFYPNEGSGSMDTITCMYDSQETQYLPANTFTRSGFTFDSWWFTSSDAYTPTLKADKAQVKNWNSQNHGYVNLFAQWKAGEISYQIAFDGNGADSGSMAAMTNIKYNKKVSLTRNAYGRTGYTFYGWTRKPVNFTDYLKNRDAYPVTKDGSVVSSLTNVDGATVTYYALWKPDGMDDDGNPIHYTIYFNGNGADSGSMDSMTMTYGETKELPANGFEKTNCHFTGWAVSSSGKSVYADKEKVKNLSKINGATVILYACWEINAYSIRFDGNGADAGSMENQSMIYSTAAELQANAYTRTGYQFAGWNTETDGSGTSYTDRQRVINLIGGHQSVITLYARWTPVSTTIHFDGNGADSGKMGDVLMYYENARNLPENKYGKIGYYFTGWNTKPDGSGTVYCDGDLYLNLNPDDKAEITLYAQWTGKTYQIRFDGNGADSGSMENQSMLYGTPAALSRNQYGKTGYQFENWNTAADGTGTSFADGEVVNSLTAEDEITLYACWVDKEPPQFEDPDGNIITEDEVTYGWTNEDVAFVYYAEDLGSGLKNIVLKDDQGNELRQHTSFIRWRVRDEGITKLHLIAADNSGNEARLKINCLIDKTVPTLDNAENYSFQEDGTLPLSLHADDEGGSGIQYMNLYSSDKDGTADSLNLLKTADSISGSHAELNYTFQDDFVSDEMYYTLITEDNAGNAAKHTFRIQPSTGISGKEWRYDKTTVYDDTQVLSYIQYGDMRTWFEVYLSGYLTEVTYDFDDDLNALGVEDVTHALQPAATVTDNLEITLPTTMTYDKIYTVTIKGKRQEREVSMTLYLRYVKMTLKPHPSIRYQNGMAMPKDGGEWIDYEKEAEMQREKIRKYRESLLELPEDMQKKEE